MTAVGIDMGKGSLDLAVDGQCSVTRYPNAGAGIIQLIKRLFCDESHR